MVNCNCNYTNVTVTPSAGKTALLEGTYYYFFYENDIHKQSQTQKNKKITITSCQKYVGATGKNVMKYINKVLLIIILMRKYI